MSEIKSFIDQSFRKSEELTSVVNDPDTNLSPEEIADCVAFNKLLMTAVEVRTNTDSSGAKYVLQQN